MRVARGAGVAGALWLTGSAGSWAAAPHVSAEEFASGAAMEAPRISPDGGRLVYLSSSTGTRLIVLRDLHTGQVHSLLHGGGGSFRATSCSFKSAQRLLCHFEGVLHSATEPFPVSRLVALDPDGGAVRVLFQNTSLGTHAQYQDRIVSWLPDDPHHVLVELADRDGVFPAVYRVDVDSGAPKLMVAEHPPVMDWIADHAGVVRFGYGFRGDSALYVTRNGTDDSWHALETFRRFDRARFEPLAFGVQPNQLYVVAPQQRHAAVWRMDPTDASDLQLVFAQPQVDVQALIEWPSDWHVAGFQYETDRPHIFYLDPQAQAVEKALERALPNTYHRVIDATPDSRLLVVMSSSDVVPPRYDLFDTATGILTPLGAENAAISPAQLAPMTPITVPGPGGTLIPGYLTLPRGAEPGKPLPAVVFPHGGPHARDSWGYDPLLQLMANRGYAVLQLNFRGSSGYGEEWQDAGHQAWGTIMSDDITAGARWLIDQRIADPRRLCIVGWSYGGYAALIGVVRNPGLYRCAASIAGVTDLGQLARDDARFYGGAAAAHESTGTDEAELKAESPLRHADRIGVPVLLVHGEDDTTVRAEQSRAMARALARQHVPYELVLIKDGEHGLRGPQMRLTLYRKLETFLAENLK